MAVITLSSIYMDLVRINISLKILYINKLKICGKRYTYLLTYLLYLLLTYFFISCHPYVLLISIQVIIKFFKSLGKSLFE